MCVGHTTDISSYKGASALLGVLSQPCPVLDIEHMVKRSDDKASGVAVLNTLRQWKGLWLTLCLGVNAAGMDVVEFVVWLLLKRCITA